MRTIQSEILISDFVNNAGECGFIEPMRRFSYGTMPFFSFSAAFSAMNPARRNRRRPLFLARLSKYGIWREPDQITTKIGSS
jgi:hypothetical protein